MDERQKGSPPHHQWYPMRLRWYPHRRPPVEAQAIKLVAGDVRFRYHVDLFCRHRCLRWRFYEGDYEDVHARPSEH